MKLARTFALALLLAPPLFAADNAPPPGFKALFNGRDLTGWVPVDVAPTTYTVRDGMIIISGIPTGYMRTDRMYENFILECDWQHMQVGGNSGVFVWGDGVPAVGTGYTRGIEVQVLDNGYNRKGLNTAFTTHGDIFPIQGAAMTPFGRISGKRSFPTEERSKSSPEWNHYRLTGNAGELRLEVNGKEVTVGKECVPRKGFLALESEGSECHFKNLYLQELPATHTPPELTANAYEGYVSIFNGVDFTGWSAPGQGPWQIKDGVILREAVGGGVLQNEREYGDCAMIVDWRPKEAAADSLDTGLLLPGSTTEALQIKKEGVLAKKWNRLEITVQNGRVALRVNGAASEPFSAKSAHGKIGLSAAGPATAEYRNLFVKPL